MATQRPQYGRPPGSGSWRRAVAILALGVGLFALAVVYLAVPAASLPAFLPGRTAGESGHQMAAGIFALIGALACLILGALAAPTVPLEERPVLLVPRLVPRPPGAGDPPPLG